MYFSINFLYIDKKVFGERWGFFFFLGGGFVPVVSYHCFPERMRDYGCSVSRYFDFSGKVSVAGDKEIPPGWIWSASFKCVISP